MSERTNGQVKQRVSQRVRRLSERVSRRGVVGGGGGKRERELNQIPRNHSKPITKAIFTHFVVVVLPLCSLSPALKAMKRISHSAAPNTAKL